MNVPKALEALIENQEQLNPPEMLCRQTPGQNVQALMDSQNEDLQQRTNAEWKALVEQESDPLEAAKLILDWLQDKVNARIKQEGYAEEASAPESQRMSR